MNLKDYVDSLPDSEARQDFADRIGAKYGYLRHVMHGRRKVSDSLAIAIERETSGAVRCEELCPETDWQYIRSTHPESGQKGVA